VGKRGSRAVAAQTLEGLAIVVGDHDAGVPREAGAPGAKPLGAAHRVGGGGGWRTPGRCGLGLDLRKQIRRQIDFVGVVRRTGRVREPARDPTDHPIEDREQVCAGWRGKQRERQAVAGPGKHAIGDEQVEVDVHIDQATEPLHEGDVVARLATHARKAMGEDASATEPSMRYASPTRNRRCGSKLVAASFELGDVVELNAWPRTGAGRCRRVGRGSRG